jgi:hypothetical protein
VFIGFYLASQVRHLLETKNTAYEVFAPVNTNLTKLGLLGKTGTDDVNSTLIASPFTYANSQLVLTLYSNTAGMFKFPIVSPQQSSANATLTRAPLSHDSFSPSKSTSKYRFP